MIFACVKYPRLEVENPFEVSKNEHFARFFAQILVGYRYLCTSGGA
jgi:hypothetical protein